MPDARRLHSSMSERGETKQPERGDEVRDPDGSVWIVTRRHFENGPYYSRASRVRKGSLAAETIFGKQPPKPS